MRRCVRHLPGFMGEKELKELSLEELIRLLASILKKSKEVKPETIFEVDDVTVLFECADGRILDADEFFTELAYSGVIV